MSKPLVVEGSKTVVDVWPAWFVCCSDVIVESVGCTVVCSTGLKVVVVDTCSASVVVTTCEVVSTVVVPDISEVVAET